MGRWLWGPRDAAEMTCGLRAEQPGWREVPAQLVTRFSTRMKELFIKVRCAHGENFKQA